MKLQKANQQNMKKALGHPNLWRKIIGYDITSFKLIMAHI